MSQVCQNCNVGITSTDYDAVYDMCGNCLHAGEKLEADERLALAEKVIDLLLLNGRDCNDAVHLAFEYDKKYHETDNHNAD